MIVCTFGSASPNQEGILSLLVETLAKYPADLQSIPAGLYGAPCLFLNANPVADPNFENKVAMFERPLIGFCSGDLLTVYPMKTGNSGNAASICMRCLHRRIPEAATSGTGADNDLQIHELREPLVRVIESYLELLWHRGQMFCPGLEIRLQDHTCRFVSLLPMPDCETCAVSERAATPGAAQSLLALAPSLVHWPGGVLKAASTERLTLRGREGPLWIGRALTETYPEKRRLMASGRAFTPSGALVAALGEAAEIYTACSVFPEDRSPGSFRPDGEAGARPAAPNGPTRTTSGCAVHTDRVIAIESAFREVVERDAFIVNWHLRHVLCHFQILTHPDDDTVCLAEFLLGAGYRIACTALATDFPIEVVQVILWHDEAALELPFSVCGLGTGRTAAEASTRALMEAAQMIPAATHNAATFADKPVAEWGPEDHGGYYGAALRYDALRHVLDNPNYQPYPMPAEDAAETFFLHRASMAAGCQAYVEDMTSAELKLLGITSLRVTIPHLLELYFGLNPDISKLDRRSATLLPAKKRHSNPWPHPLM